jgi:DNA polymerase III subunit beta
MKFSVSSAELLKQLQVVSGAISSNPVLPILEGFLFKLESNQLTIAGSDLETSITTKLSVNATGEGAVAIPARILMDTLKALPEQPITIEIDNETFAVTIVSAYGQYKLAGENGGDFPRVPESDGTDSVEIPGSTMLQAIAKTLFATSSDDLRPAMTGVFFQIDFNKVTFVATDAHKLVRFTTTNDVKSEVTTSFIVPKKALNLLKGSLPAAATVHIDFNKNNAFFSFGDVSMVCRLIDARYPDYNAVIPTENPNVMTLSRTSFQSSLKRINIYANKTTNQAVLNIQPDVLTLKAQDLDFSNEANEQLSAQLEGEALQIAFNAKFLIEMLGVLEGDEIRLEMSTPSRAGILRPTEQVEGEDILMLVMPVMFN